MVTKLKVLHCFGFFLIAVAMIGCGGSSSTATVKSGKLATDIKGLSFKSGGQSSVTGSAGTFSYEDGKKVQFSVGAMSFGNEVTAGSSIKIEDLFTGGETGTPYAQALQILIALDSDLDSTNGITIDATAASNASVELAAIQLSATDFDAKYQALIGKLQESNNQIQLLTSETALVSYKKLEVMTLLSKKITDNSIPGIQLSLELPNGEMWHTAAGKSDTTTGEALGTDHAMRIGSVTKTFVALLIMQLVDEGKLTLEQTVEEFLPGQYPNGSSMTIKMLLNHTAGVFTFTNEFPGFQDAFGVTLEKPMDELWFVRFMGNSDFDYTNQGLVDVSSAVHKAFVATEDRPYLVNAPGAQWNYSNTHYVILSLIAEQITGKSWEEDVETRFVQPLGLTSTVVPRSGDSSMPSKYATGYINWVDNQGQDAADLFQYPNADMDVSTFSDPSYTGGSGCMISTCRDLTIWSNAIMKGLLLSADAQAKMLDPILVEAFGEAVEMNLGVVRDVKYKYYGHRGQTSGYDAAWQFFYTDADNFVTTGHPCAILINRTLLRTSDGHITNSSELVLNEVLEIVYGADATSITTAKKTKESRREANQLMNEY